MWTWIKGWFVTKDAVRVRARELVQHADTLRVSGEYKRHTVYSRLIKEFPQVDRRRLSLTIEQVLPDR